MSEAKPAGTATAEKADRSADRQSLVDAFQSTRNLSAAIAEPLATEDMVIQSMPDVSPTKWHLAHTSWFFETFILKPHARDFRPFGDAYEFLFNSYYNAIGKQFRRPERGLLSRPTVVEVFAYRQSVDERIQDLAATAPQSVWAQIESLLELGIHHEQQHQELMLTDIKHVLSRNPLAPAAFDNTAPKSMGAVNALSFTQYPGGIREIGFDGNGFAFDCEGPRHQQLVRPFSIANRLVTNGEYLEFINDGAYREPSLWLSDAWTKIQEENWDAPLYWRKQDGQWSEFTLSGERSIELAQPVTHVSFYEANAYASWRSARLPTEAELEIAAHTVPAEGAFLDMKCLQPKPLNPAVKTGIAQIYGDVWEWTQSPYAPYPGFKPASGAVGEYNGKFMCDQFVLKGGSCATPCGHIRPTYRNFFPANARWQFSGIRLAIDEPLQERRH
jgi:ergothioneine biosynthesis protein EgtB